MSEEMKDDMFDEPFPTEEQVRYAKQILYYGDSQPFAITLFNHILHLEKQLLEAERRGEERGFEAGWNKCLIYYEQRAPFGYQQKEDDSILEHQFTDWRNSEEYKK